MSAAEAATDAAKTVISAAIELIEDFTGAPFEKALQKRRPESEARDDGSKLQHRSCWKVVEAQGLGGFMGCTRELPLIL
jgi:hypothetical protein